MNSVSVEINKETKNIALNSLSYQLAQFQIDPKIIMDISFRLSGQVSHNMGPLLQLTDSIKLELIENVS